MVENVSDKKNKKILDILPLLRKGWSPAEQLSAVSLHCPGKRFCPEAFSDQDTGSQKGSAAPFSPHAVAAA